MRKFICKNIKNFSSYVVLILATIFALGPIYWVVNTSLKGEDAIVAYPPQWLPVSPTFGNYIHVLTDFRMIGYYRNSIILAILTILLVVFVAVHAGYAAARFNFKGKNALLFLLLATVMVPGIVTLIPLYLVSVQLDIHDTYLVLILVFAAWQTPTAIWLLRAFFESIPRELEEAALIDGCNRLQAFYRVILPLASPGLAAAAIVVFVWVWNEFIISLNLTASDSTRPITVGLYFFVGEAGIIWGKMTSAASFALLPVILIFAILRRRFVEGLTAGALKG